MSKGEMLERREIDGEPAWVAYLTHDFEPADRNTAELIKVMFDNGDLAFLVPKREEDLQENC